MARPLRIEYPGAVYHLTSRGNRQESIFEDDADRYGFLDILGKTVERYNWICHAYCLMNNHYHLLVETPDANLSLGMRQLNGVYTQYTNRRHGKVGHVFQGRFHSVLIEKETYLLELCRYIVLNPIRAKMCMHPVDWVWSSYIATASGKRIPGFLTTDWILRQFARQKARGRQLYVDFVADGYSTIEQKPWHKLQGQILLGGERFQIKMRDHLRRGAGNSENPKVQRQIGRPLLSELLPRATFKDKPRRNEAIRRAHLECGYTLKEIAEIIGIHYTTVSKVLSREDKK